uniref:glycosyltransferase family 39 protein n=1 Tax=Arenimonas sp. TaxID=1872635 RepID=UPI0025EF0734
GALAHYRFAGVLLAGLAGLLLVREGRALFREPGLWLALLAGAAAWWPLLAWNLAHAGAGLDFHLVQRHPWQPQVAGAWWPLVQALVLTPPLFVLLVATLAEAWRRRRGGETAWPLLLGFGAVATTGYFLLGFFADTERVSFHWPLAGWLALCVAAPVVLARWPRWAQRLTWAVAGLGLAALLAYLALLAAPAGRAWLASGSAYADNFSGWDEVAAAVQDDLRDLPRGTTVVADNFMLGAQLSLALGREVRVLEHPLNAKHGRAVQLAQWGLLERGESLQSGAPVLLVVEDTARPLKDRHDGYRGLCALAGVLPPPRVLNVDQGRKRFLRFGLTSPAARADARADADAGGQVAAHAACVLPALAWIDSPRPGDTVAGELRIEGWALKSGAGLARVEVLLDGEVVAQASHGLPRPDVATYWGLPPGDGDAFGFTAAVPLDGREPGRAWLGLRLHATDGSVEDWPAVPVRLR